MPGGALAVEIGAAGDVTLTGPVTRVAEGTLFPETFDDERDVETVPDRSTGNR
jgi:hypothetical protein